MATSASSIFAAPEVTRPASCPALLGNKPEAAVASVTTMSIISALGLRGTLASSTEVTGSR